MSPEEEMLESTDSFDEFINFYKWDEMEEEIPHPAPKEEKEQREIWGEIKKTH